MFCVLKLTFDKWKLTYMIIKYYCTTAIADLQSHHILFCEEVQEIRETYFDF